MGGAQPGAERLSNRRASIKQRRFRIFGSSTRDHRAEIDFLGETFVIERIGMDGSIDRAIAKIKELDGNVDAIGLGGIDVYLYAGKDRYALRDGLRLLAAATKTPVVDGSGLKNTLDARPWRSCRRTSVSTCAGRRS